MKYENIVKSICAGYQVVISALKMYFIFQRGKPNKCVIILNAVKSVKPETAVTGLDFLWGAALCAPHAPSSGPE